MNQTAVQVHRIEPDRQCAVRRTRAHYVPSQCALDQMELMGNAAAIWQSDAPSRVKLRQFDVLKAEWLFKYEAMPAWWTDYP